MSDPPVIDHLSVGVASLAEGRAFYDRVLAVLDVFPVLTPRHERAGYGRKGGWPVFWIEQPADGAPTGGKGTHVCVTASSRAAVDAFHAECLAAGGSDDGPPGLRPQYHPAYYGAFVRDPWGNKLEAARHVPE